MVNVCVVLSYPFVKINALFFSIFLLNQPPISDSELSDFVDWDQLSSMADGNDDSSSPGPKCPFIDWEAKEEDPADVPAFKRTRKRACFSEGADTDETVA